MRALWPAFFRDLTRRALKQWFIKTREYADELLEGLDSLDKWPEAIKLMQRNWIGQSKGHSVDFQIFGGEDAVASSKFGGLLEEVCPCILFTATRGGPVGSFSRPCCGLCAPGRRPNGGRVEGDNPWFGCGLTPRYCNCSRCVLDAIE